MLKQFLCILILSLTTLSGFARQDIDTLAERVYTAAEAMPDFPGGTRALLQYISQNLRIPKDMEEQGCVGVQVKFVINKKGRPCNIGFTRPVSPGFKSAIIKMIREMPQWKPGLIAGQAVNVWYGLPLYILLQE